MSKAADISEQLNSIIEASYKAINEEVQRLRDLNKGGFNDNDQYGRVYIVEFGFPMWLNGHKDIIGIGKQGNLLYLYIKDTSIGKSYLSGADYLLPFLEAKELNPHYLITIISTLEGL